MPHPSEIVSLPTILSSLALLLAGCLALAMISMLPTLPGSLLALAGSAAIVASLYFLQLELRIFLLAAQRYREEE